jgi:hypothetical protein
MKRIGYDADTSRYIFRDRDGSLWQGPEGSEYGEMNRGLELPYLDLMAFVIYTFWIVGRLPSSVVLDDDENRGDDVEAHALSGTQSTGYQLLSTDTVSIASALNL